MTGIELTPAFDMLIHVLGFSEAVATLAAIAIKKCGFSNRLAVLANGNPLVPEDVIWAFENTTEGGL